MRFGRSPRQIEGSIGYFRLADWWLTSFTEEERAHIQQTFQPLGGDGNSLTAGRISYTTGTAISLLQNLAGWFAKENDRSIAHRMLDKALDIAQSQRPPILDQHFLYQQMIEIYYRDRDDPSYLAKAVEACQRQIDLAPDAASAFRAEYRGSALPSHKGFEQLSIIQEKQGAFTDAIELCRQAQLQGWAGDWAKRMERLSKKLQKSKTV